MKCVYVYGAGGLGTVVAETAEAAGYEVVGFIDDDERLYSTAVLGLAVLGGPEVVPRGAQVAIAVGDLYARARLLASARSKGWQLPTIVHPQAIVSRSACIGDACIVKPNAVVETRATIGDGCIINTACSVAHDCVVGACSHIASGCRLGGNVRIGQNCLIGIGTAIRPRVTIGSGSVIGAGSTVVCDIPESMTAFGNPARVVGLRREAS